MVLTQLSRVVSAHTDGARAAGKVGGHIYLPSPPRHRTKRLMRTEAGPHVLSSGQGAPFHRP